MPSPPSPTVHERYDLDQKNKVTVLAGIRAGGNNLCRLPEFEYIQSQWQKRQKRSSRARPLTVAGAALVRPMSVGHDHSASRLTVEPERLYGHQQ